MSATFWCQNDQNAPISAPWAHCVHRASVWLNFQSVTIREGCGVSLQTKKKKKGTRMKRNSMQGNEGRMPPVTHSITCAHGLHKRSNSLKRNPGFSFPHSSGCSMQHGLSFTYILPWRINHECDVCWEVMHLPGSNRAQIIIWHVFGVDRWGRKKKKLH